MTRKYKNNIRVEDLKNTQEISTYKLLRSRQHKYKYDLEYETERLEYTVHKTYVPDFILKFPDGRKVYIEFKGYLRRDDERKLVSIKQQHPDKDIRIVFQKDLRMGGRKMRYSDWANKHGYIYAIGEVPQEWLEETSLFRN